MAFPWLSLVLSLVILGFALARRGWTAMVWFDLFVSGLNAAWVLYCLFP